MVQIRKVKVRGCSKMQNREAVRHLESSHCEASILGLFSCRPWWLGSVFTRDGGPGSVCTSQLDGTWLAEGASPAGQVPLQSGVPTQDHSRELKSGHVYPASSRDLERTPLLQLSNPPSLRSSAPIEPQRTTNLDASSVLLVSPCPCPHALFLFLIFVCKASHAVRSTSWYSCSLPNPPRSIPPS